MPSKNNFKENIDNLQIKYASLEAKNTVLESEVLELRKEMSELKNELMSAHLLHQEAVAAQVHVEIVLESVLADHEKLIDKELLTTQKLETLEQYSRKFTLILSGKAVPSQAQNENIRQVTLRLFQEYLGINLSRDSITACHRLPKKNSILVRFKDLDDRMRVYLKRTKPQRHGLLVFESLTKERMAVVQILNSLRHEEDPPFKSFFTFRGDIFIKVREGDKPIQIPVGSSRDQILGLCRGKG